ncbi:hypothetical protein ACFL08_03650 [Patescibacteria group bacterium]
MFCGVDVRWSQSKECERFVMYLQRRYGQGPFVMEGFAENGNEVYLSSNCGILSHQDGKYHPIPFSVKLVEKV